MITKQHIIKTKNAGFVLGAVLLAALANGAISADAQVGIRVIPPTIVVAPPVVAAPVVVVQDDYVYYPNYGVYYNSHRHQYYYLQNNAWVIQPQPFGVTAEVLLASPSVNMDFHDSPSKHHDEMLKRYPHDWHPPGDHQDHQDQKVQHDEHHDSPNGGGDRDDHKR